MTPVKNKQDSSSGFMASQGFPAPRGCECTLFLPPPAPNLFSVFSPHFNFPFLTVLISNSDSYIPFLCDPRPFVLCCLYPSFVQKLTPECFSGDIFIDKMPHKHCGRAGPVQAGTLLSLGRLCWLDGPASKKRLVYRSGSELNRVLNAPGRPAILRNPAGLDKAKNRLFELLDLTQFCNF